MVLYQGDKKMENHWELLTSEELTMTKISQIVVALAKTLNKNKPKKEL